MSEVINNYETVMVINPTRTEEEINALTEKFKTLIADNGEVLTVDVWGKKRLAYPIEDLNEGHYVLITFKSNPDFPKELGRVYKITEGIMRTIIIRLEEEESPKETNEVKEPETEVKENAE